MTIPQNSFIYISLFIIAIYLLMCYFAYKKGFLYELVSLFYTLLSLLLAWFAAPVFSKQFPLIDLNIINESYGLLDKFFNFSSILNTIIYFIIIFLLLKLLYIFMELILKSFNKIPVLGKLNQLLGIFLGLFNATIIALALCMLLRLPVFANGKEVIDKTVLRYIRDYSDQGIVYIAEKIAALQLENDENFDVDSFREQFGKWLMDHSEHE